MPGLTIDAVLDRVNSLVASPPFRFTRAIEPFSFDLQPVSDVHEKYRIEVDLDEATGYLGWYQNECWRFDLWLAVHHQRDPHGAQRGLLIACSSITATLARVGVLEDFNLDDADQLEVEVRLPDDEQAAYVVGRLTGRLDFDRAL